ARVVAAKVVAAKVVATVVAAAAILAVTACGGSSPGGRAPDAEATTMSGRVTVFAAASLTEAFTRLGAAFEAAHPGTAVTFGFGGSSALAAQINSGAPADVFASASPASMKVVTDAGNGAGTAITFARNQLVIGVPEGNPKGLRRLADLARPDVKVALCAPQVPCGAAARIALAAAGVTLTPVTLEQDVKAAVSKLRLGEIDAALVYRTDVRAAASELDGVEFPESAGAVNDYPITALANAPNPRAARAFVAFVLSAQGRAVLARAGFQAP
ncbi:MAG TPA: molybdate ABC transporter substrate-binding protein, partial [Cryptosporangiaceae bacterium]|nr:molybdate ABC transporter substrate-binding protein [Cryptosporangiaceae bacterium]